MSESTPRLARRLVATLIAACAGGASQAQDVGSNVDTWWLRLSAFHADLSTRVRIDDSASGAPGTDFEFERLGMPDKKTLPAVNLGIRLSDRWRVEAEYFQLSRSGRALLDGDLKFDQTTFPVKATFDSKLRSDIARASVGYSIFRSTTYELGAVVGLHVTKFDMALESSISVNNAAATVDRASKDATVPLPTVGGYGSWGFVPGWTLDWRADFFSLNHRGYDGRLLNGQANILYRFTRNAAFGGGLRYVDYKLRSERSDIKGKVNYKFTGPQLFVELGF